MRGRAPRLVAIDAGPGSQGCPPGFSVLDYLRQSGFLAAHVELWYEEAGTAGRFRLYVPRGTGESSAPGGRGS